MERLMHKIFAVNLCCTLCYSRCQRLDEAHYNHYNVRNSLNTDLLSDNMQLTQL